MFKSRRKQEPPATLIGQYLRTSVLRQDQARAALKEELDARGWRDADVVARVAFETVVRDAYRSEGVIADIPVMVEKMREFFGADGVDRVPQKEGELLVRAALGEKVSTNEIPVGVAFAIHALVFGGLCLDLGYDEQVLDKIIVDAEQVATSQGFAPILAGRM